MNPEFGTPPPVSAWSRVQPYLGGLITAGALAGVSLYALQIVMPTGYKPMEVMGDATASFENHELAGKMAVRLDYERRILDAQAQANAKTQADLMIVTTAVQQASNNTAGFGFLAQLADIGCIGGKIIAANTRPTAPVGWQRQSQDIDWHSGAQNVANATCGVGDDLRQGIQAILLDAGQTAAAKRGMSTTDGSVRQASTVQPVRTGTSILHREWTPEQRAQLVAYSSNLPRSVRVQMNEGLDVSHDTPPEWYDRVAAYRFEHP